MWKAILLIVLVLLGCFAIYEAYKPAPSSLVAIYTYYYNQMGKTDYKSKLLNYTVLMHDPIAGLNYTELVYWVHRHLTYTTDPNIARTNMPLEILASGVGRCGEFSLLYTGLCLAVGIPVRLIVDESTQKNWSKTGGAGDHMWCEVFENQTHVEVTQSLEGSSGLIVNQPHYYTDVWNKDVNKVTAIDYSGAHDDTERYV